MHGVLSADESAAQEAGTASMCAGQRWVDRARGGGSQRARAWQRWTVENTGMIRVPTPVLVGSTTGDARRDAEVNRILGVLERAAAAVLEVPGEATARLAGRPRFRAGSDDGIDALVAAAAISDGSPAVLLTSDPHDLATLLAGE